MLPERFDDIIAKLAYSSVIKRGMVGWKEWNIIIADNEHGNKAATTVLARAVPHKRYFSKRVSARPVRVGVKMACSVAQASAKYSFKNCI